MLLKESLRAVWDTFWLLGEAAFKETFDELLSDTDSAFSGIWILTQQKLLGKENELPRIHVSLVATLTTILIVGLVVGTAVGTQLPNTSSAFVLLLGAHAIASVTTSIARVIYLETKTRGSWVNLFKFVTYFVMVVEATILILWLPELIRATIRFIINFG